MWEGHVFGPPAPDGGDDTWKYRIAQKELADVTNPPEDWTPDKTFIKRKVHLVEPPSELDDPYVRVQVDNERDRARPRAQRHADSTTRRSRSAPTRPGASPSGRSSSASCSRTTRRSSR